MKKSPNILLIFTDMQRADTIHALNNPVIKTPNLDRLVHEGSAFSSCYSPSPVCVPARCCMHYGLYPQNRTFHQRRNAAGQREIHSGAAGTWKI